MVTAFSGLEKEWRLQPAKKETHEVIRQRSDKATFVGWKEGVRDDRKLKAAAWRPGNV